MMDFFLRTIGVHLDGADLDDSVFGSTGAGCFQVEKNNGFFQLQELTFRLWYVVGMLLHYAISRIFLIN